MAELESETLSTRLRKQLRREIFGYLIENDIRDIEALEERIRILEEDMDIARELLLAADIDMDDSITSMRRLRRIDPLREEGE